VDVWVSSKRRADSTSSCSTC